MSHERRGQFSSLESTWKRVETAIPSNLIPLFFPLLSTKWGETVVNTGKGRLFRRKDGKYLIYLPKDLAEDSMFPFRTETSVRVKVSFDIGRQRLLIEKL